MTGVFLPWHISYALRANVSSTSTRTEALFGHSTGQTAIQDHTSSSEAEQVGTIEKPFVLVAGIAEDTRSAAVTGLSAPAASQGFSFAI